MLVNNHSLGYIYNAILGVFWLSLHAYLSISTNMLFPLRPYDDLEPRSRHIYIITSPFCALTLTLSPLFKH